LLQRVTELAIGYDPSPGRRELAAEPGCLVVHDEQALRAYGPFDLLVCDNVLEHVPDPSQTVRQLAHLSAEGATLFVSVPSYEEPFIQAQLRAVGGGGGVDMTLNPWEHLNYFSLKHLDRLMLAHGFSPIRGDELPGKVDIGLRPDSQISRRLKNGLASALRLWRYVVHGASVRNANEVFYKYTGARY
jgi:hypothetical protein